MVTGAKAGKQCEPPRSLAFASLDSAVPATGSTEKFDRSSANYRSKKDPEGCAIPEREDLSLWTMKRGGPIRQDSRLYASPYSLCWTRRPPFKPPNNSQRAKCRPSSARSRHWCGVARASSRRTSTRSTESRQTPVAGNVARRRRNHFAKSKRKKRSLVGHTRRSISRPYNAPKKTLTHLVGRVGLEEAEKRGREAGSLGRGGGGWGRQESRRWWCVVVFCEGCGEERKFFFSLSLFFSSTCS